MTPATWVDPFGLYDREAAVKYALTWFDDRNPEYYRYVGNGDCANFASQVLYAGGIEMNEEWHSYRKDVQWYEFDPVKRALTIVKLFKPEWSKHSYNWDVSDAWNLALDQYNYFSKIQCFINGDVIVINKPDEISDIANNSGLQVGDLLYLVDERGPHRVMIISKIEDGEIHYAAHSNDQDYAPLSWAMGKEKVYAIRIKDDA